MIMKETRPTRLLALLTMTCLVVIATFVSYGIRSWQLRSYFDINTSKSNVSSEDGQHINAMYLGINRHEKERFGKHHYLALSYDRGSDAESIIDDRNSNHTMAPSSTHDHISIKSPACHPHFKLALPDGQWSNIKRFKRIYFYHARKAGGTSINYYLRNVARHYGLDYTVVEWDKMEEPGSFDNATFYVTHLREPVDRAISHFKYEGRWNCKHQLMQPSFIPTEENANTLETWNQTGGHTPCKCKYYKQKKMTNFFLGECAVNCYSQWFSGLSCPKWNISSAKQFKVAKSRVLRYNLIVVIEKLQDPKYVDAIEKFFNVPGIQVKRHPWCEAESRKANEQNPFIVRNDTRSRLVHLNEKDIRLYDELSECLNTANYDDFPKWDPTRWAIRSGSKGMSKQ